VVLESFISNLFAISHPDKIKLWTSILGDYWGFRYTLNKQSYNERLLQVRCYICVFLAFLCI